ncbi:urea carboxylase-associated family protein [uncultured Roseobacter sp.]|uniref:urea carboxylase-associated family protein n=1 Tax=uncultured Roseobacter sp. TaxID=114847 RepID=UPI00261CD539|nr:urea carboxylase-associated family protein [uncultured Roseobacter sp.]
MPDTDPSGGTNQTPHLAVSPDGTPAPGRLYTLPARCGIALRLRAGQQLRILNPSGHQVCDFWAFAAEDLSEHLSMAHLHTSLGSVFPRPGDALVSGLRRPLMTLTEDSSPGVHDTVVASCDPARYRDLGCAGYHDNCADNLRMALAAIGLQAPRVPAPFNIWMNVPIGADGSVHFAPPVSAPGDHVTLRAETPVIAVMSACPQDMTPVNGAGVAPDMLQFQVPV